MGMFTLLKITIIFNNLVTLAALLYTCWPECSMFMKHFQCLEILNIGVKKEIGFCCCNFRGFLKHFPFNDFFRALVFKSFYCLVWPEEKCTLMTQLSFSLLKRVMDPAERWPMDHG